MFHTVFIEKDSHLGSVLLKPSHFLCLHVKRVCITYGAITMAQAIQFLSTCTNILHLALWLEWPSEQVYNDRYSGRSLAQDKLSMIRVLSQLHSLRRVELPYEQLVEIEPPAGSLIRWGSTLTHFEFIHWDFSSKDEHIRVPLLRDLVSLTHLFIGWQQYDLEMHEKDVMSILEAKPSLQVALVYTEEGMIPDDHIPVDARIVYRTEVDNPVWQWRDQGPMVGKWVEAEEEIARRRRGYEKMEGGEKE
jgi:hypothetical protein